MARKRTKEEAKERIDSLPLLPPIPTPVRRFVPAPIRALYLLQRPVKELAKLAVDADPLNRLGDETSTEERLEGVREAFELLVNDPNIKMGGEELQMINDDNTNIVRTGNGSIPIQTARFDSAISNQFDRASLLSRLPKRGRKKTKTDKTMSKALQQANKELRKKNGQYRSGVTQADIMRRAHRIRRKMS